MKLRHYLRERAIFLISNIFLFIFIAIFLWLIKVQSVVIVILFVTWFGSLFFSYISEFIKQKKFYDTLQANVEMLDQKYLLSEIMEEPDFLEGQIVYNILKITDKQMHEHVNYYKQKQADYREYIEAWVHEIKTPIATSKLILENQQEDTAKGILEELVQIEDYVEQALYYARSNSVDKDYVVKEFNLKNCVSKVIKRNAKSFIHKKIQLQLTDLDEVVFSDEKWVAFILNQIIVNAIHYCNQAESKIHISAIKHEHNLVLKIADNGIGIDEKDVGRVFEKGFTGENGRIYRKSTGMGLYICKTLAEKLHLGLTITSTKNVGTEVNITFPKSKILLLES